VAGAAALVAGAGWVSLLTSLNVVVQMLAPEAMAGRVLSVYQATTFGGMAVGSWLWGALADATSLATALRAGSLFLLAALIVLRFVAPMPGSAEMHRHRGR
jgi:MFS family permease